MSESETFDTAIHSSHDRIAHDNVINRTRACYPANRDLQVPTAGCPPGSLGPQRPSEEPMQFQGCCVGRNRFRTTGREYLAARPCAASIPNEISESTQVQY